MQRLTMLILTFPIAVMRQMEGLMIQIRDFLKTVEVHPTRFPKRISRIIWHILTQFVGISIPWDNG